MMLGCVQDGCIAKVAAHAVYWHCKNLSRVYHPENERAVFIKAVRLLSCPLFCSAALLRPLMQ